MPNKIDALYAEVSKTYDVGSIQDFQNYLADPKKRQLFFKDVIAPEYDVKSLDEFEQAYGLKKKESVSPSQQKKGATSSATGAMGPDGAPAPSARKRYDVKGKPAQPVAPAAPAAQLTAKDLEMMMPFRGAVQETTVIGDAPAVQENPFAQDVKRAGDILTKKSPEGDAFTAGIITEKPETKKYAKEVLAAVEAPQENSYIEKVVNSTTAAGLLANKIAASEVMSDLDDVDFEEIAGLNKQLQDNAIEEEEGVVGFIKYLPTVVMQSAGSMIIAAPSGLAAGAAGAGVGSVIPGIGTAAGAAAGFASGTSLALEYSSSLMGSLKDAGVDITDADQLKAAFNSPEKMSEAKSYALKRGIPVAIFDAISGGIAGKLFKTAAGATAKQVMKAGAKEVAVQSALGGAGEASAQVIADGKLDARQIAYEMVAEPVTSIPSAAINYLGDKAKTAAEKKYVKRIETDANLKLKSDIATIVDPEIAASSKKINEYRKLKEEAVSQTAKDEYDKRIAEERDKKYSAYEKFFPVFDSLPDNKKQEAYDALDEVGKVKDEYNAAESPEEKKILGQVLAQKLNKLKTYAVQEPSAEAIPNEISSLRDDETVVISVGSMEEIPDQFKDRAQKKQGAPIEIRESILGLPIGKKTTKIVNEGYSYTLTGKEAKNYAVQEQTTSEVPVQPGAAVSGEVAEGKPKAEPEVVTEEGQAQKEVNQYIADLQETKQSDPEQYWSVDSVTEEAAKEGTVISDEDGGVVVSKEGDIKGLFKKIGSKAKGVAQKLLQKAIDAGGIKLDNFDNYLTPIYEKAGFRVVSRVPFNEEYAPEGWNKEKHGTPDVVAMVYDPENKLDIQEQKFDDYDQAMAYRDQFIPQVQEAYPVQQQTEFDQAVANSAQSLKMVAPDLKIIVAENTEDAQLQIAEALSGVAPDRAADVAEGFTTETRGQTVFVNGKPFAIVLDKSQADSKTVGHEAWELMLNDAFGDDQAKFKEFRDEIDRQLRLNGYGEIADALTKFSNQRGYEDVKYSEYMAELGGMLVADGFKKGSLDAKQKSLLQKIGDVINKFAQLFTGKKQFLDEATPDDILGFMITISNKVAKGEDVSTFFRGKVTPSKTDNKGNLKTPTVNAKNQLKEKTSDIEKKVKASVSPGNIVSTRIPAKGDPHSKSDLVINTESIMKEAKENKNAEKFAITIARKVADYPIVNVSPESINTIQDANKVFEKLKEGVKGNLKWLYDQFSDEVRTITKLWYDGANKISNEISKEYGYTLDQVAGVMAVLSPQMDWFRNLSLGRRVIDIYNTKQDYSLDDKMANYMLNAKSEGKMLFNEKLTKKEIGLLVEEMKGKKFKELSLPEKAFFVRAYDEVYNSRDYENISPTGEVNGFVRNADGSRGKVGWGGFGPIIKSISILEDGKIKNISENLGEQHKVRNFFNNISSPNDKNAVTIDTHAVAAALLEPLAGSDEQVALNLGGPKTNSIGSVGTYAIYADAYRELASELGILPRELQSITWEAVRGLYKAKFKQSKKNKQAIKDIWEQFRNKEKNIKEVYESINEKAGGVSKPVWYEYVAEGDSKTYEENSAAVDQAKLSEDYQLEQPGGRAESVEVTTRSQKSVPAVVDDVLTDDGKGNYVFVHYSDELRDTIKPMSGSKKNFTSREEVSAISAVGGVAMYYTKQGQVESGVGNVPHTVLVPKDKVYFYGSTEKGTVSHDPEGFEEEARQRFQAYRNRGNEDRPTKYAFDANNSAAWVTKVAAENGYDMLVTNWGGPKSYRAQTTKELKPETDYTGFKEIPEPTYEVGDEIFLYGRYATVVAVDGNTLSYESPNAFGRFDTGKFTLSPYTSNKIMLIEKAKPTVTTKSQKVVVNTIPGYERMMGEVEGILDKTMNRTGSYNQATANAVGYIQKSSVYERADDSQREQIIRDFVKLRGEKIKVAPSVGKILGQIKNVRKITVNDKTVINDRIKLEAKAANNAVSYVKELRMQISNTLRGMAGRGVISAKQASAILARYDRMNILKPDMRDRFVDYMANVFQSAEYADKVKEATRLRKTIRKAAKNPDNQAESSKLAKTFAEIDPSRVENIDDYLNNAEQILKSVSRKTGDVKMRSLVNMTDMVSYIDKEIQEQRKQIKNEILSKYQDLVDAGVLDSKMTINEINKVVAAIEEKKDESVAKAKEAKEAVKQMMDEVSPILLQIARTGEDPFTGDPIDLTQDEKSAIVKLAKMDLDNLSLSEAVKALEYANNFIANGVTSGIVGMVDLYEGSLNAEKLVKKGFKSIPFKKYFSKRIGRTWAEQIASLPMVNKLIWGTTNRALEVSDASGVTGVSNGKAKAIKIVERAVKEYVATFSKVKGFLSSENVVERGMLAFVSRTVIGDEFQVQAEFNRRKKLIYETIQALKDPENSTEAEIKKGEVVEKVYNKILKDAKNVREVRVNVSDINQSAVDWWVNEWSKHYDRMDEVSRNVYNTLLSRDSNFTPDRFQLKEVSPATQEDFDSGFFGNFEYVSTERAGSLKKNNLIPTLPENSNKVKTRIVNLDFDVNNVNALTNAMVDVETAGSVMQMKGFVTSKDFGKLFSNQEDKNMYKRRLVSYVNRAKGQGYVDQGELKSLNRLVNAVASFGTAKALFSLSQPFKQSIPPLFNTLVQTGRLDLGTLMVGGFSFIDRTGYPIANRGISSQGELKSINRQLVEAEKNLLLRGVDGVAAYSNLMLELTLKYPDIMTARSSWLSFYKKGLKKEGIKTSGINWNTHEVNKKAADYAQMMVDSQQNISDSDMQGEFMASKDPAKAFLRRAIFPLMTFVLNQKTRIWADIRTLSNKAVTTTEDRQEAALSLAGALVELGAFSAISYAANSMLWEVAMNILAAVSGEDDDDDREEEKKKMILRRSAYTAQNFMKDFFVPPIPGADLLASKGINYILDETNLSSEIPADWFGIDDDRVKFRLYDKENQGYLDMLGTQGIALEKALELADYYDMAIDGTFKEESYGTKREKQILEGDADMARINAAIMTGYYGGLLPADVAYIVGQINKKIKKRAEVVEEED
jgi:hypothetical protein